MNEQDKKDYAEGWRDCRTYSGKQSGKSEAYHAGFAACVRAYHERHAAYKGWDDIPLEPQVDK